MRQGLWIIVLFFSFCYELYDEQIRQIIFFKLASRRNPTLRAEATFSRYEMASEKWPLPTTVQFSIVHAQNSPRDSQATGSSNLREFRGNQSCENYLRTTLLGLLFCFFCFARLVLSILAAKFPRIVF